MPRNPSRAEGTVTTWNDDRGFGFITPSDAGRKLFFHISAYESFGRPIEGDLVNYDPSTGPDGRPQALDVLVGGLDLAGLTRGKAPPRPAGVGSLAPVVLLIAAYFVADRIWFLPSWLPWLYIVASVWTFLVYAFDKYRAKRHGQRVSEAMLLFLGFIGGWPGAIVAQLVFRHKTVKRSFRKPFWATVVVNLLVVVGIVWLLIDPLVVEHVWERLIEVMQ